MALQRNSWSQSNRFALKEIPIFAKNLLHDLSCKKLKVTDVKSFRVNRVQVDLNLQATSLHYPPCSTMTIDVESGRFINGGIEFLIFDAIAKKLK